jgi:hypothetical protein
MHLFENGWAIFEQLGHVVIIIILRHFRFHGNLHRLLKREKTITTRFLDTKYNFLLTLGMFEMRFLLLSSLVGLPRIFSVVFTALLSCAHFLCFNKSIPDKIY